MLQWLNDLFYFFAKFFPRILVVRETHGGVRFRFGKAIKIKGGQVIFYWPIITQVVIIPIVRQSNELALQILTTHDGYKVAVGAIIVYEIEDSFKAITNSWDIYRVIDDYGQMVLGYLIPQTIYEDIQKDSDQFNEILFRNISDSLKIYGIKIIEAKLTNFARCMVLRNVGDNWGSLNPSTVTSISEQE